VLAYWPCSTVLWRAERPLGMLSCLPNDTTRLLIDALCFKKGFQSRAQAWESLGISPNTGAGWCNPAKPGIKRWPAFAALRTAVLEGT